MAYVRYFETIRECRGWLDRGETASSAGGSGRDRAEDYNILGYVSERGREGEGEVEGR